MGILYNSVQKLNNQMKHKAMEEQLAKEGIMKARDGRELSDLNYEELKRELAIHKIMKGD